MVKREGKTPVGRHRRGWELKLQTYIFPFHAVKANKASRGTAPLILNLENRWR
jgi:hypothetical protein